MNRRDREKRRKQKRQEKRRTAPAPVALPQTPVAVLDRASSNQLVQLSSRCVKALSGDKTRTAMLDAAALSTELVETTLEAAWRRTDLVPACKKGCSYC